MFIPCNDHQLVAGDDQAAPVRLGVEGLLRSRHGMPRWRIFLALFCWYFQWEFQDPKMEVR